MYFDIVALFTTTVDIVAFFATVTVRIGRKLVARVVDRPLELSNKVVLATITPAVDVAVGAKLAGALDGQHDTELHSYAVVGVELVVVVTSRGTVGAGVGC